jgi:hypothetical protein
MQKVKAKSLLVIFIIVSLIQSKAQFNSTYEVGINVGTFIYYGDLTPSSIGSWKTPGFVWGLTGLKHLTPTISVRLDMNFGKLRGDEAKYSSPEYRQYRAFAFNSRVTEAVLSAEWSPLGRDRKLSPYLFGGMGYASMKITRDYSRFNEAYFVGEPGLKELLAQDAASSPKGIAIVPVGFGLKYALNNKFSLTAEASHRFTRSDYIDGFSHSGNPDKKDSYSKISLGLRYSIGNKDPYACPPMRY